MIKPSELRIGNYVSFLGNIVPVSARMLIDYDTSYRNDFHPNTPMQKGDLEPVVISSDILLRISDICYCGSKQILGSNDFYDGFRLHNVIDGSSSFVVWVNNGSEEDVEYAIDREIIQGIPNTQYLHTMQSALSLFGGPEITFD